MSFTQELEQLINRHSRENESNTPDFILAAYVAHCLDAFNCAVQAREKWYGREEQPVMGVTNLPNLLNPCPFCSGEAAVEREGTARQSCIVVCTDCGCRLESNEIGAGRDWNRREPQP